MDDQNAAGWISSKGHANAHTSGHHSNGRAFLKGTQKFVVVMCVYCLIIIDIFQHQHCVFVCTFTYHSVGGGGKYPLLYVVDTTNLSLERRKNFCFVHIKQISRLGLDSGEATGRMLNVGWMRPKKECYAKYNEKGTELNARGVLFLCVFETDSTWPLLLLLLPTTMRPFPLFPETIEEVSWRGSRMLDGRRSSYCDDDEGGGGLRMKKLVLLRLPCRLCRAPRSCLRCC